MLESGAEVRHIDNPGRTGTITNRPTREKPSGTYYQVRWSDGAIDYVHEQQLESIESQDADDPFELARLGQYGRDSDLRRNLTFVHLAGRLANLVYAMGITNTDFYPHQYRPLLALLDSPINGLLIADEVGLGKTIESGLIWTELRARFDMRLLVIVCPAMLREKWRDELYYRFGVDARIVNAAELLDELRKSRTSTSEGRALIVSYQGVRPPRSWRGGSRRKENTQSTRSSLANFLYQHAEEEPLIDLVVFDEAHYMRNSDSATWRVGELMQAVSHYQVMLSATPINLRNLDLFNLLRLLDPDQFGDEVDFSQALEANAPLVAARDATLNKKASADQIIRQMESAASHPRLAHSRQLQSLLESPPTDADLTSHEYRVRLADSLERLNLISHVITRTRKKDVQKQRIHREVHREPVEMTEEERKVYDLVTQSIRSYALQRDISDGFLLATPQRQITSCAAAVVEAWSNAASDADDLDEDATLELLDLEDGEKSDIELKPLRSWLASIVPSAVDLSELRRNDSKFNRLVKVLSEFFSEHPKEKVILFTSFRATARYLVTRLAEAGIPGTLIWGNQRRTKQEVISDFRDSSKSRILISTEVASEGVDLQFCRVLVNYDLPWNPTRIEQRIGRIDRLGQKAAIIHIWNLYLDGTIDQRVISRLLDRLRIFEEALGESEAVVGEEIRKLETRLLSRNPTPEEEAAEFERTALALENIRRQREELERNAAHMMAHGQLVLERIEAADKLARRVTEQDLVVYIEDYLANYWPGHRFSQDPRDGLLFDIDLPSELRIRLDEFLAKEGLRGQTQLTIEAKKCRVLNKISEKSRRGEEIIHQFHPLIRFISRDIRERNEHFYRLVAIELSAGETDGLLMAGTYVFYSRIWTFSGVREEEMLAISAVEINEGRFLDKSSADQLVQFARLAGRPWLGASNELDTDVVLCRLDQLEEALESEYAAELERKRNENSDRARFQEQSVTRHLQRKIPKLEESRNRQIEAGRSSLAKAFQGQIDKLQARMKIRLERIKQKEEVRPSADFICAGVIKIS